MIESFLGILRVGSKFISQAVVLAVLLLLLVAYTAWFAFETIQPLNFSTNQIVLVITALMTAVSTIVGCIAVYGTVIPWYQFYLNDQTYECNTRHHKKPAISGGF